MHYSLYDFRPRETRDLSTHHSSQPAQESRIVMLSVGCSLLTVHISSSKLKIATMYYYRLRTVSYVARKQDRRSPLFQNIQVTN